MGLVNGAVLALAITCVALGMDYVRGYQAPIVALLIGLAFLINTVNAVCLGGIVPLARRRFKLDPALGAPPILTTLTDMCGFFILLTLATLAIRGGFVGTALP